VSVWLKIGRNGPWRKEYTNFSLNSNTKYTLLLKEGDILFSTRSTPANLGIVRKFLRWLVPILMSEVELTCGVAHGYF
jgi:hypothetical protein